MLSSAKVKVEFSDGTTLDAALSSISKQVGGGIMLPHRRVRYAFRFKSHISTQCGRRNMTIPSPRPSFSSRNLEEEVSMVLSKVVAVVVERYLPQHVQ